MKTLIEYITDLKTATRKWGHAILVVALATDTRFVSSMFSTWPRLLKKLVRQGGIPVGMLTTLKSTDGKVHFRYCVLEGWAKSYMTAVLEAMAEPYPGEVFWECVDFDEFCPEDSALHDELPDENKNREKFASATGSLEEEE